MSGYSKRRSIMSSHSTYAWFALAVLFASVAAGQQEWKPKQNPLFTRWTKLVKPGEVHTEYPRPQLQRPDWQVLNGLWDYSIRPRDAATPTTYEGKILVPFPIESALSGVKRAVGNTNALWLRRTFDVKRELVPQNNRRLILHFGAVDWEAIVFLNGTEIGRHRGGYDPFSLDITDAIRRNGEQLLEVRVIDDADEGYQPRGKQVRTPNGIWYTSVTGIHRHRAR
jgi:hypothetical protein